MIQMLKVCSKYTRDLLLLLMKHQQEIQEGLRQIEAFSAQARRCFSKNLGWIFITTSGHKSLLTSIRTHVTLPPIPEP